MRLRQKVRTPEDAQIFCDELGRRIEEAGRELLKHAAWQANESVLDGAG